MNLHDVPDFTPKPSRVLDRDGFGRFVARWYDEPVPLDLREGTLRPMRREDEWADFGRRFAEAARRAALGG